MDEDSAGVSEPLTSGYVIPSYNLVVGLYLTTHGHLSGVKYP